jgi:hypothetical protein
LSSEATEAPSKEDTPVENTTVTPTVDPIITEGKEWKPLLSQLNDAQLRDVKKYTPMNQFEIEVDGVPKTYTRKKIKTRDYSELEKLRAEAAKMRPSPEKSVKNMEVLQKAALFYLGMTAEDFEVSDFEVVKRILESQNIRTIYGVPNS